MRYKMTRKAKNCYGCPAETIFDYQERSTYCLLNYERVQEIVFVKGITTYRYSPKECCHKPKTVKEFSKRLKNK